MLNSLSESFQQRLKRRQHLQVVAKTTGYCNSGPLFRINKIAINNVALSHLIAVILFTNWC